MGGHSLITFISPNIAKKTVNGTGILPVLLELQRLGKRPLQLSRDVDPSSKVGASNARTDPLRSAHHPRPKKVKNSIQTYWAHHLQECAYDEHDLPAEDVEERESA